MGFYIGGKVGPLGYTKSIGGRAPAGPPEPYDPDAAQVLFIGLLMVGIGALIGAIVGGIMDSVAVDQGAVLGAFFGGVAAIAMVCVVIAVLEFLTSIGR